MSIHALKVDDAEPESLLVIHRNFDGEHVLEGTTCWCRPEVVEPSDGLDSDAIVEKLERADG